MLLYKFKSNKYFNKMSKTIGIDLGTTNSCVAIMDGKNPKVIENTILVLIYRQSSNFFERFY